MDDHSDPNLPRRKDSIRSQQSVDLKSDTESLRSWRMGPPRSSETPPVNNFRYQPSSLYYGLRRGPVVIGLIEMLVGIILLFPSFLLGNLGTCYVAISVTIFTGIVGIGLGCICIQPPNPLEITEHDVRSLLPMLETYLAFSVIAVCLSIASIAHGAVGCALLPPVPSASASNSVPDRDWRPVVSIVMGSVLFFLNLGPVGMVGQQLLRLRKPNVCADLTERRMRPLLIGGYHPSASSFNLNTMTHLQSAMRRSSSSSNTLHLLPSIPDNQVNLLRRLDKDAPPPVTIGHGRDFTGRSISVTVNEYK